MADRASRVNHRAIGSSVLSSGEPQAGESLGTRHLGTPACKCHSATNQAWRWSPRSTYAFGSATAVAGQWAQIVDQGPG